MADMWKVMQREMLHSEHAARCYLEAKRRDAERVRLCDCADNGAHCLGRQEGKDCMAHDKWYVRPCSEGKCPGPGDRGCCGKSDPNEPFDHTED